MFIGNFFVLGKHLTNKGLINTNSYFLYICPSFFQKEEITHANMTPLRDRSIKVGVL